MPPEPEEHLPCVELSVQIERRTGTQEPEKIAATPAAASKVKSPRDKS